MSSTRRGAAQLAVAQDGHPVGELAHLGEAMGDVDDGGARAAAAPDVLEQQLDRVLAERRRRLVEDEQRGLDGERLGELEQVLLRDGQGVDAILEVRAGADVVEDLRAWTSGSSPAARGSAARQRDAEFSATVMSGSSAGCWWTMAMPSSGRREPG